MSKSTPIFTILPGNRACAEIHTANRYGGIDILVNNASKQIMCKDFSQINLDNVESTFQSNIIAMFAITKFALPHMEKGSSYVFPTSHPSAYID
jgi:NADP-dependent 3-hydroxy acid dehydrogenase YdfG